MCEETKPPPRNLVSLRLDSWSRQMFELLALRHANGSKVELVKDWLFETTQREVQAALESGELPQDFMPAADLMRGPRPYVMAVALKKLTEIRLVAEAEDQLAPFTITMAGMDETGVPLSVIDYVPDPLTSGFKVGKQRDVTTADLTELDAGRPVNMAGVYPNGRHKTPKTK